MGYFGVVWGFVCVCRYFCVLVSLREKVETGYKLTENGLGLSYTF